MVIMSTLGNGSLKKSPEAVLTRSLNPAAAMCFRAIGSTGGRSKEMHRKFWMCLGDFYAKQASRAPDAAKRLKL
jgi:hypothetical protein